MAEACFVLPLVSYLSLKLSRIDGEPNFPCPFGAGRHEDIALSRNLLAVIRSFTSESWNYDSELGRVVGLSSQRIV